MAPEAALTVATDGVPEVQVPPASPLLVNVVVPLEQMACVPLKVPALGGVLTVMLPFFVTVPQPPVNVTV